jgi:hypothetical protein
MNEPVAWLLQTETAHQFTFKEPTIVPQNVFPIPLYTRPAKTLELTEDEIDDVWAACSTGESDTIDMHLFAEAILRKAQEK